MDDDNIYNIGNMSATGASPYGVAMGTPSSGTGLNLNAPDRRSSFTAGLTNHMSEGWRASHKEDLAAGNRPTGTGFKRQAKAGILQALRKIKL